MTIVPFALYGTDDLSGRKLFNSDFRQKARFRQKQNNTHFLAYRCFFVKSNELPISTVYFVFDDQKPFREKVSGLPKAFYKDVFGDLIFSWLHVSSRPTKFDSGFRLLLSVVFLIFFTKSEVEVIFLKSKSNNLPPAFSTSSRPTTSWGL